MYNGAGITHMEGHGGRVRGINITLKTGDPNTCIPKGIVNITKIFHAIMMYLHFLPFSSCFEARLALALVTTFLRVQWFYEWKIDAYES